MGIQVQTVDVEFICKNLQRAIKLSKSKFEAIGRFTPIAREENIEYWWTVLHFVTHDLVVCTKDRRAIEHIWRDAALQSIRKYYKQPV